MMKVIDLFQRSLRGIFVLGILFLFIPKSYSQLLSYQFSYTANNNNTPVSVNDNATVNFPYSPGPFLNTPISFTNKIVFGVNHNFLQFYSTGMDVEVDLKIERFDRTGASMGTNSKTLEINYYPFTTQAYIDRDVFINYGAAGVKVTIDDIRVNNSSVNDLPNHLFIDVFLEKDELVGLSSNPTTINTLQGINTDCDTNGVVDEIEIAWNTIIGAEEYQLEWTFVNDYGATLNNYLPASSLKYDFKNNSTRISTTNTSYKIANTFDHGYILFRVRGIGQDAFNPGFYFPGPWNGNVTDVGYVNNVSSKFHNVHPHELNKNWQLTINYAEEGKKKESINYMDGSMRSRQTLTRINTDRIVIAGETVYDHQGRPAVTILPTPVQEEYCQAPVNHASTIKYYTALNKNTQNAIYSKDDFDIDNPNQSCVASVGELINTTGASNYYSSNNPFKDAYNAFIPDAENYPFSMIEYTPDNTGRIRRQGGVGAEFQINNNHDTRYYYGQPNQLQLDRLFGAEVGDAAHYKKNMVIDPNGQVSVSYLNMEGKTVATSLAGDAPPNLEAVASDSGAVKNFTVDLFNKNSNGQSNLNKVKTDKTGIEFTSQILATTAGNYKLDYTLLVNNFTDNCTGSNVCYNCVYDLEISVIDECGQMINASGNPTNTPILSMYAGNVIIQNNELTFTTACNPSQYTYNSNTITLYLNAGSYTIHKKLNINTQARNYYLQQFLDTNLNSCIVPLSQLQANALANIDTSDCYIDCNVCVQSLGTKDEFVSSGKGTALEWDLLYEECLDQCDDYVSLCDQSYQLMLIDVSPGGQYCNYKNVNGIYNFNEQKYKLSLLYYDNKLPGNTSISSQFTLNTSNKYWRNPKRTINGNTYNMYIDDATNQRTKIRLSNINGVYTPAILSNSYLYSDSQGYYTFPEYLAYVEDFVDLWEDGWEKSLVEYHPEYCYYKICMSYSKKVQSSDTYTSESFDKLLTNSQTFAQAVANGLINSGTNLPTAWSTLDPFILHASNWSAPMPMGTLLDGLLSVYQTVGANTYKMYEYASMIARCGTQIGAVPSPSCIDFGSLYVLPNSGNNVIINDSIKNLEWNIFKSLYLANKRALQSQYANYSTINTNPGSCEGFNACIGSSNFNPYTYFPQVYGNNSSNWSNPSSFWGLGNNYNQNQPLPVQPCDILTYSYYASKTPRFMEHKMDMPAPSTNNLAAQIYYQTGLCPIDYNFLQVLNELADKGKLTHVNYPMTGLNAFNGLFLALTDYNPSQPMNVSHNWGWSSNVLSGNLNVSIFDYVQNTVTCNMGFFNDSQNPIIWSQVQQFKDLVFLGINNGNYTFEIKVKIPNGLGGFEWKKIQGYTSCFAFMSCSFDEECNPNELAIGLQNLMSALLIQGELDNQAFSLASNNFNSTINVAINNTLGQPTSQLRWEYNSGGNNPLFLLYDGNNTSTQIMLEITNISNNVTINTIFSNGAYFNNINTLGGHVFTVDVFDFSGNKLATITGKAWKNSNNTNEALSMGACEIPGPLSCNLPPHHNMQQTIAMLSNVFANYQGQSVDLTQNVYFTSNLCQYLSECNTQQGSSSANSYVDNGVHYDELIFEMPGCELKLIRSDDGNPDLDFTQIVSVSDFQVTGEADAQGNFYEFSFTATYAAMGMMLTGTVHGTTCWPLLPCPECIETELAEFKYEITEPSAIEDTCSYLYNLYTEAYNWRENYNNNNPQTACDPFPSMLSQGDFEGLGLCCNTQAFGAFNNYIQSFYNTALCPEDLPVWNSENCKGGNEEPSQCERDFNDLVALVNSYNNSAYATSHGYSLSTNFYSSFYVFSQYGFCNCEYRRYARNLVYFIDLPANDPTPPPVPINQFENCGNGIADNCTERYQEYLDYIDAYNTFANSQANINSYPEITQGQIASLEEFINENLCLCLDKYVAFLESLMDNVYTGNPQELEFKLSLSNFCEGELPCASSHFPETPVEDLPPAPYENPCVTQLVNMALQAAWNQYQQQINDLTTYFINLYNTRCTEALESFTMNYDDKEFHFTLYYYDQSGNLIKTVPPEGVEMFNITSYADTLAVQINSDRTNKTQTVFTSHRLASIYNFNSLNQTTRQQIPDHDAIDLWETKLTSGFHPLFTISSVNFVNNIGYASGTIKVNGTDVGLLYRSNDEGSTWQPVKDVLGAHINKIVWTDANTAYAAGQGGTILKTTDGGHNWLPLRTYLAKMNENITSMAFKNANEGVFICENGTIITTANAGQTFTKLASNTLQPSATRVLKDITWDGLEYFLITQIHNSQLNVTHTEVFSSSDGVSWTLLSNNIRSAQLNKVNLFNSNRSYLCGDDGQLYRFTDGSNVTYEAIETGLNKNIRDVYFKDWNNGIIIADSIANYGQIYKTHDGGKTWVLLSAPGAYYNTLFPYYENNSNAKVLAIGHNQLISRVIMYNNTPFGIVPVVSPNIPAPNNPLPQLDAVWAQRTNANAGPAFAAYQNNLYYTPDIEAGNSLSWSSVSGIPSNENIKELVFAVMASSGLPIKGIVLTDNGKLYLINKAANSSTISLSLFTPVSNIDYVRIALDETNKRAYAIKDNASTVMADLNAGTVGLTTVSSFINLTPNSDTYVSLAAFDGNVYAFTAKGEIYGRAIGTGGVLLGAKPSRYTYYLKPLAMNSIRHKNSSMYMAGTDGDVYSYVSGVFTRQHSHTTTTINGIDRNSNNLFAAAQNGMLIKFSIQSGDILVPQYINTNVSENLYAIAVENNQLHAVGQNSRALFIADVTISSPLTQIITGAGNSHRLNALAYRPSQSTPLAYAVGNHAQVHSLTDNIRVKVNNVFTNKLFKVHFADGSNGFAAGAGNALHYTIDGANTWHISSPNANAEFDNVSNIHGVYTYGPASAFICGDKEFIGEAGNNGKYTTVMGNSANSAANVLYDMYLDANNGYAVGINGTNGRIASTANAGISWTINTINGKPFKALCKIPNNNHFMAVGPGETVAYVLNGTVQNPSISIPPSLNSNFNDVFFTNAHTAYIAGSNGVLLKAANLQPSNNTYSAFAFGSKNLNDGLNNQSNTANMNVEAVAFTSASSGFIGGAYNAANNYARKIKDESGRHSVYHWYDRLGRLILSQNSKQHNHNPKQYSYTLYDALGRITEAGQKDENTANTRFADIFGAQVNNFYNPNVIDDTEFLDWINGNGQRTQVTKTYYDEPNSAIAANLPNNFTQQHLRKRVACVTYEDVFDNDDETYQHATHYTYDIHGNVNTLLQDNPQISISGQRFKRFDYSYDLISGNVKEVAYQKAEPDQWYHRYEYDADNRITHVYTSKDHIIWDRDLRYFYYKHGPLARVEYGDNQVQATDYAYTLQGWIKGINSETLSPVRDMGKDGDFISSNNPNKFFAQDAYAYSLGYFANDYTSIGSSSFLASKTNSDVLNARHNLWNGNIGSMITTITDPITITNGVPSFNILAQGTAYKYDQLNRLIQMQAYANLDYTNNLWINSGLPYDGRYENTFTYDANGNITGQLRKNEAGVAINNLTYNRLNSNGKILQNRLYHVNDAVALNAFNDDIDDQGTFVNGGNINAANNYGYTEIGELNRNDQKEIAEIKYTATGKVKEVIRIANSSKKNLKFDYDAMGNRIAKHIYSSANVWESSEYYIKDAQGNTMSVYKYQNDPQTQTSSFAQTEKYLYGSTNFGKDKTITEMIGASTQSNVASRTLENKHYNGANHLGNILTVFTDKKYPLDTNTDGTVDGYLADVISSNDYYPFGVVMKERSFSVANVREQFNGKEYDTETETSDFGARNLDSDLGVWGAIDPLQHKYPSLSPYNFVANSPLILIDPNGKEIKIVTNDPEFRGYILNQLQKLTDDKLDIDLNGVIQIIHRAENPSKQYGTELINQLISSKNTHFILQSSIGDNHSKPFVVGDEAASNGVGIGTTIMIDPNSSIEITDQDGVDRVSLPQIVLGHELIHSSHADKGIQDPELADPTGDNYPVKLGSGIPLTKEEIKTREKENLLRTEQGITNLRKVSGPNKANELRAIEITTEDDKK
ncbi:MAG: YCF48-related protein [Bacteroidia bacterium]